VRHITESEWIFGAIFLLAYCFFAYLDFYLANEITTSISYVSLLGFGLLARSKRLTIIIGVISVVTTATGMYLIPSELVDTTNRQLVIIAIITITITSHIFMDRQQAFEEKLYRFASTDALTGVANRRTLANEIEQRLSEALRYKKDLSLILFDLDNFKQINDKYGHLAGDEILKKITEICLKWLRITDVMGRYGGEEFMVVCPNTSLEGALTLGERIRVAIQNAAFRFDNDIIKITVSVGVTELRGHLSRGEQSTIKMQLSHYLIDAADTALYNAKSSGKNCVIAFDPEKDRVASEQTVPV